MKEGAVLILREEIWVDKYEGEPVRENLFERVHLIDGKIVAIESYEGGKLIATEHRNTGE